MEPQQIWTILTINSCHQWSYSITRTEKMHTWHGKPSEIFFYSKSNIICQMIIIGRKMTLEKEFLGNFFFWSIFLAFFRNLLYWETLPHPSEMTAVTCPFWVDGVFLKKERRCSRAFHWIKTHWGRSPIFVQ